LLIVVFIILSSFIAISQYNSSVNFIAQLMGISWALLPEHSLRHSSTDCIGNAQPNWLYGSTLSSAHQ